MKTTQVVFLKNVRGCKDFVHFRQLGYDSGWPVTGAFFGPGSGTIWLDEIVCSGAENDINSCRHEPVGRHDCTHSEDAGVICGRFFQLLCLASTNIQL